MDISKLPKFTQMPPSSPPGPIPDPPSDVSHLGVAEAWFSIAIGLIVLFVFPYTIQYLHSPAAFEKEYPYTDAQLNPIHYTHTEVFWADLGMTVFGAALLIEGLTLLLPLRRALIAAVLVLTSAAGIFNLYVVIRTYDVLGFQFFCAIAVAISGYMALTQWRIMRGL